MKIVRVIATVIKVENENGQPIICATIKNICYENAIFSLIRTTL